MRTIQGCFAGVFLVLFLFSSNGVLAQGQPGTVDITGEAAVEIADFFTEDRSELYYFIVDKQSRARTQVFFSGLPDAVVEANISNAVTPAIVSI